MPKRYGHQTLHSLWKDSEGNTSKLNALKIASGNLNSYCKKLLDDICLKADLAESLQDYTRELCEGMVNVYQLGIRPWMVQRHSLLVQKLLSLGRDILDGSRRKGDLFYIGALIELKIIERWKEVAFYQFVLKILDNVIENADYLGKEVRGRIEGEFLEKYPKIYELYFGYKTVR